MAAYLTNVEHCAGQLIVALYTAAGADHVAYMYADLQAVDLTGATHDPGATVPLTATAYQVRHIPSTCILTQLLAARDSKQP